MQLEESRDETLVVCDHPSPAHALVCLAILLYIDLHLGLEVLLIWFEDVSLQEVLDVVHFGGKRYVLDNHGKSLSFWLLENPVQSRHHVLLLFSQTL